MARLDFETLGSTAATRALIKPWSSLRDFMFDGARLRRHQLNAEIAAIAGSAGKTTVKEMLGSILKTWSQTSGRPTHISMANQNTKMALATQILRLPENCAVAVFEIGARRVGDFQIPLSFVQPQVVTLLNVGTAHIGEFGSLENLQKEKLSILQTSSAETLVIPSEDSLILRAAQGTGKKLLRFGFSETAEIRILEERGFGVKVQIHGDIYDFETRYEGPKKSLNMAASIATAIALGFSIVDIQQGLKNFSGVSRRFETLPWKGITIIDDAFNASPESMREGLQHLKTHFAERKTLLVIGSMLELGPYSPEAHRLLGQFIIETIDGSPWTLFTVGDEARFVSEEVQKILANSATQHFRTSLEAKTVIEALLENFDLIYFKGSKGIQLQKVFTDS